ncbi:hypothetical protein SYK_02550 [Pseudodesulfovibrio nedwellii]|uniref:Phage recombination protein Bet n=1 Tax=Pseudodesulfovibrio nedwellii TaxID=2973072 RepID=A0ABN6RY25_9BACT|nr:phage recombination protein Bet [Pseudodesulfovibrio nedwellii]BDQ35895.1 hypothetical protein SYK_02550 [Pseudodesulfovibrio nedwellii]
MTQVNNSLVPQQAGNGNKGALIAKFSEKFGVDQNQLAGILKATCFKQSSKKGQPPADVTNEQMAALLIVADQYGLNPFTKEIYAFPDKGKGIVPIVGVDGWTRIMNEHPAFDGMEFNYSEDIVTIDADAKPCPAWIEVVVYRTDRTRPIKIREYLAECYRPAFDGKYGKIAGPWQSHTSRFLRHKALIQGARTAFGFSGIYEEDEAKHIAEARVVGMNRDMPKAIDTKPVKTKTQTQHSAQDQPSPEDALFDSDGTGDNTEPTEDELAINVFDDAADKYNSGSAADKKARLLKSLKAYGANQNDMEKLVGKTYGQWALKERIALLKAYRALAFGEDPAIVFPTQ